MGMRWEPGELRTEATGHHHPRPGRWEQLLSEGLLSRLRLKVESKRGGAKGGCGCFAAPAAALGSGRRYSPFCYNKICAFVKDLALHRSEQ